jgi:hypothetical protein
MKLFVDDIRRCPDGWELARTNTKAIRVLATFPVDEISIDHDICCQVESLRGMGMMQHTSNETYMPVVFYILAMARELRPKIVHIHTANTYAGNIMMDMLKDQVDTLERDWSFAETYGMTKDEFETWEKERREIE